MGRLGLRENKMRTVFIDSPEEFFHYVTSSDYDVHSFDIFSEDIMILTYKLQSEFVKVNPK